MLIDHLTVQGLRGFYLIPAAVLSQSFEAAAGCLAGCHTTGCPGTHAEGLPGSKDPPPTILAQRFSALSVP